MIDEFVKRKDLFDCLKKIRYSLDCRFEEDANLFITNQLSQEIKGMIRQDKWQGLNGMLVSDTISANILSIEILKHAWLIKDINSNSAKYIKDIFNQSDKNIIISKLKLAMDGKTFTTNELKEIISCYYYLNCSIDECELKLDNITRFTKVEQVCVERVLNEESDANYTYKKMRELAKNSIFLSSNCFNEYLRNGNFEESFIRTIGEGIFEDHIEYEDDIRESEWFRLFRSLNKVSFDISINSIKESNSSLDSSNLDLAKYVIYYQVDKDKMNREYYINEIIRVLNSSFKNRRFLFIGIRNIYSENIKNELVDKLLNEANIKSNEIDMLEKYKTGREKEEIDFDDVLEQLLNDINYNIKPAKINYWVNTLFESNKVDCLNMFIDELEDESVQMFIQSVISQACYFKIHQVKVMTMIFNYLKYNEVDEIEDFIWDEIRSNPNK
ncbi:MAG: hypothetical protein R3Y64_09460, partial [Peptostreptococcaceae bacterium]